MGCVSEFSGGKLLIFSDRASKILTNFDAEAFKIPTIFALASSKVGKLATFNTPAGVLNVASLPTLDEARANIVGILNASASKLVSILLARSEKMSNLPPENSETQPKE